MRGYSIKFKLSFFFSLVVVLICAALSLSFFHKTKTSMIETFIRNSVLIAQTLANNSRYGIITEDRIILEELISGALQSEEIVSVTILDFHGRPLAQMSKLEAALPYGEKNTFKVIENVDFSGIAVIKSVISRDGEKHYLISFPVSSLTPVDAAADINFTIVDSQVYFDSTNGTGFQFARETVASADIGQTNTIGEFDVFVS